MLWDVAIACEMINVIGFEGIAFIPHQHCKLGMTGWAFFSNAGHSCTQSIIAQIHRNSSEVQERWSETVYKGMTEKGERVSKWKRVNL